MSSFLSSIDTSIKSPEQQLLKQWNRYGKSSIGRRFFSLLVGRKAPYSGSIKSQIISLTYGEASVFLKDRHAIRNHLNSIHAIALANLGELASGLAMLSALPKNTRAIVVKLDIEYLKKARGNLIATGFAEPPKHIDSPIDSLATADIKNADGDTVSIIRVLWHLSPKEQEK